MVLKNNLIEFDLYDINDITCRANDITCRVNDIVNDYDDYDIKKYKYDGYMTALIHIGSDLHGFNNSIIKNPFVMIKNMIQIFSFCLTNFNDDSWTHDMFNKTLGTISYILNYYERYSSNNIFNNEICVLLLDLKLDKMIITNYKVIYNNENTIASQNGYRIIKFLINESNNRTFVDKQLYDYLRYTNDIFSDINNWGSILETCKQVKDEYFRENKGEFYGY